MRNQCHENICSANFMENEIINCPAKVQKIRESSKRFEITLRVYDNVQNENNLRKLLR